MAEHIAEEFNPEQLGARVGLSEFHFQRLFKRATGVSPTQFQIDLRTDLPAAHFEGRCRISANACNRFASTALLVMPALSFSDRAKLWSFASSPRF